MKTCTRAIVGTAGMATFSSTTPPTDIIGHSQLYLATVTILWPPPFRSFVLSGRLDTILKLALPLL